MTRCCVNQAEEKLFRIAVVKPGQNVVGQKDAVDHPEPLPMLTPGRVEVLVIGLEEAEVQPVSIPARGRSPSGRSSSWTPASIAAPSRAASGRGCLPESVHGRDSPSVDSEIEANSQGPAGSFRNLRVRIARTSMMCLHDAHAPCNGLPDLSQQAAAPQFLARPGTWVALNRSICTPLDGFEDRRIPRVTLGSVGADPDPLIEGFGVRRRPETLPPGPQLITFKKY